MGFLVRCRKNIFGCNFPVLTQIVIILLSISPRSRSRENPEDLTGLLLRIIQSAISAEGQDFMSTEGAGLDGRGGQMVSLGRPGVCASDHFTTLLISRNYFFDVGS